MTYTKEIYINVSIGSTRIAILENSVLVELYIDIADHKRMVGNIYKGKIQNVIPGMQAAFIDIGHEINSFLPFSEIGNSDNIKNLSFSDDDDDKSNHIKQKNNFNPEKDLKINDNIFVQVIKEPFSGKGPRVTTDISFAGSLLVLVPNQNYIGISKKINDKYERRRLRKIIAEFKPKTIGIIVRTTAQGKNQETLIEEFEALMKQFKNYKNKVNNEKTPTLIHQDVSMSSKVIRDLFNKQVNNLYIDSKDNVIELFQIISTSSGTTISCATIDVISDIIESSNTMFSIFLDTVSSIQSLSLYHIAMVPKKGPCPYRHKLEA